MSLLARRPTFPNTHWTFLLGVYSFNKRCSITVFEHLVCIRHLKLNLSKINLCFPQTYFTLFPILANGISVHVIVQAKKKKKFQPSALNLFLTPYSLSVINHFGFLDLIGVYFLFSSSLLFPGHYLLFQNVLIAFLSHYSFSTLWEEYSFLRAKNLHYYSHFPRVLTHSLTGTVVLPYWITFRFHKLSRLFVWIFTYVINSDGNILSSLLAWLIPTHFSSLL